MGTDWPEDEPVVMISHSWTEPSFDGGLGRPDTANRKFTAVCDGIRAICTQHNLDQARVWLFLDWLCVEQMPGAEKLASVESLPAYVAQMSYLLVPLDSSLYMGDKWRQDHLNWEHYQVRSQHSCHHPAQSAPPAHPASRPP